MATFLHLAPHTSVERIRRVGIAPSRLRASERMKRAVFCVPVVPDYQLTFQWLRELRRWSHGEMVGVQFRVPDSEPVISDSYRTGGSKINDETVTAAEAVKWFVDRQNGVGREVLIPRRILPKEIMRIRRVRQTVGWRYWPAAHGNAPCGCDSCQAGQRFKVRKDPDPKSLLTKSQRIERVRSASSREELLDALGDLLYLSRKRFRNSKELEFLLAYDDHEVLKKFATILHGFRDTNAKQMLRSLCARMVQEVPTQTVVKAGSLTDASTVIEYAVHSLFCIMHDQAKAYLGDLANHPVVAYWIDEWHT